MSSTPVYDESRNGVDHVRLPYTLTKGVTATRERLEIRKWDSRTWRDLGFANANEDCMACDEIGCIDGAG